jgi:molecular chaperone GrpE
MGPKQPKNQLKRLKQQVDELTNALQVERADALNVRRRAEEDKMKQAGYFKSEVVKAFLPFIDNFDRALKHAPSSKDNAEWLKGLKTVEKQLWQILESVGVSRIKTVGEPFDPKLHEAVQIEEGGHGTNETVVEEFTPGFSMGNEVIRHAMVKVSTK